MYIQKIIFITLLTLIISCGGNYTGNEEEMVNSVSFELHPFLAVGHTGIIYTSRKGTLWHRISSGTVKNLISICGRPAVPKINATPSDKAEIGSVINFPG